MNTNQVPNRMVLPIFIFAGVLCFLLDTALLNVGMTYVLVLAACFSYIYIQYRKVTVLKQTSWITNSVQGLLNKTM